MRLRAFWGTAPRPPWPARCRRRTTPVVAQPAPLSGAARRDCAGKHSRTKGCAHSQRAMPLNCTSGVCARTNSQQRLEGGGADVPQIERLRLQRERRKAQSSSPQVRLLSWLCVADVGGESPARLLTAQWSFTAGAGERAGAFGRVSKGRHRHRRSPETRRQRGCAGRAGAGDTQSAALQAHLLSEENGTLLAAGSPRFTFLVLQTNTDQQDRGGWTPMHWCVRNNSTEALRLLIEGGCDLVRHRPHSYNTKASASCKYNCLSAPL